MLKAAAQCFDEAGYLATPLDDVAMRAHMTKGAVYFHFSSKQALAETLIDGQRDHWASVAQEIASRPGSALDHVVQLTYEMTRVLREDVELRAGVRLASDPEVPGRDRQEIVQLWSKLFEGLLRRAKRDGSLGSKTSPASAARVIAFYLLAVQALDTPDNRSGSTPRSRLDEFWTLALPGLES